MVRRSSRSATVPSWVALACGVATLLAAGAGLHRAPTLISPAVAAPAEATPNCPGQTGLDAPDADPRLDLYDACVDVAVTRTVMKSRADKQGLARFILQWGGN